jgi:uncharacterized protein YpmS
MQEGDQFVLTINESDMTAHLSAALAQQTEYQIMDPQIYLRDGQVQLRGTVHQSGFNLPLKVILEPYVNSQGQLYIQIISATLGPLSLPQSLQDQLSQELNKNLLRILGLDKTPVQIDSVDIGDGLLTVQGHYVS